jgi:hypothetical protein
MSTAGGGYSLSSSGTTVLTTVSEYLTIDVMRTDVAVPAPPSTPRPSASAPSFHSLTPTQVEVELVRILRDAQRLPQGSRLARHENGSVRIPSMLGVWLLSQVGRAVGHPRLVNLRTIDGKQLRSSRGVAGVVCAALRALPAAPLAAVG